MVVSAAILNYFCRSFDVPRVLIPIHVALVALLYTGALLVPGALLLSRRLRPARWVQLLIGLVPGLVCVALAHLYLADFVSNIQMGTNITYKLVGLWVDDWRQGGNLLALTPAVTGSLLAGSVAIIVAHLWWSSALRDGLVALGATRRRRAAGGVVLVLTTLASAGWARDLRWRTPRSELLTSDPLLAFARTSVDVYDDRYLEGLAALRASEPAVRAAYRAPATVDRRNVILVIADSLRADHMSVYGYYRDTTPFLKSLYDAGRLRRVDFATSTCAESNCGIISTLSSKHLRRQLPEAFKLNDLLADQGYGTYFILSGSHDWRDLRQLYGGGQTLYFDGQESAQFNRADDRVIFEGLSRVPDRETPAFFLIHLMSTHLIGIKLDEYRAYHPSDVKNDWNALFGGEYDREAVVNNYDNGVLQADAMIEQLFATLDKKGYLRDSLVIITSDHGEGLGATAREGYGHITSLYQEFINIPMLIYDARDPGWPPLPFGTQLDIAPTIVDRLGLPIPSSWEGQPLTRPVQSRTTFHQTALKTPRYALLHWTPDAIWKYHYMFLGRREEVYELHSDPGERRDRQFTMDPALLQFLREETAARRAR